MKKYLKHLLLFLTLFLLTVLPVSASAPGDLDNSGAGGTSEEGTQSMKDGASPFKSGYLIYTSDETGKATSKIVFRTWDGRQPYSNHGSPIGTILETRFGELATEQQYDGQTISWGVPPFETDTGGNGTLVKNWLKSQQTVNGITYEHGAEFVMANYLGFTPDQVQAWYDNENSMLNVEPVIYCGIYAGKMFSGRVLVGSTTAWAQVPGGESSYMARYTHGNLPNSMYHDVLMYPQFPLPVVVSGKHSNVEILTQSYGIVTVSPTERGGKQIIKVYRTSGQVDQTTYGSCGDTVTITNEDDYIAKDHHTSKVKPTITGTSDYPPFKSVSPPEQTGYGETTVTLPADEVVIIILLERDAGTPPTPLNVSDSIKAHELNYIYAGVDCVRSDNGSVPMTPSPFTLDPLVPDPSGDVRNIEKNPYSVGFTPTDTGGTGSKRSYTKNGE